MLEQYSLRVHTPHHVPHSHARIWVIWEPTPLVLKIYVHARESREGHETACRHGVFCKWGVTKLRGSGMIVTEVDVM